MGSVSLEPAIPSSNISIEDKDWGSLPTPILTIILSQVLSSECISVVQTWQNLALVNHHWYHAALSAPFGVSFVSHITKEAADWLSKRTLKSLKFALQLPTDVAHSQRDLAIISNPEFRSNNHHTLRTLFNIGIHCLDKDILSNFKGLQHLSIYSPESVAISEMDGGGPRVTAPSIPQTIGSILRGLDQLECLDIAGYMSDSEILKSAIRGLPGTIRHLSISVHNDNGMLSAVVPTARKTLEFARFEAKNVKCDWYFLAKKVEHLELRAACIFLLIKGVSEMPPDQAPPNPIYLAETMGNWLNKIGSPLQQATLAFKRMLIMIKTCDADGNKGVSDPTECDVYALYQGLDRSLKGSWYISMFYDTITDLTWLESLEIPLSVLKLMNQNDGGPRCYQIPTYAADDDFTRLMLHPALSLRWSYYNPESYRILLDPQFVLQSASTLRHLLGVLVQQPIDFRPYTALRSLDIRLQGTGIKLELPSGLKSLSVFGQGYSYSFDSATIQHIAGLKELVLIGFGKIDLTKLPDRVESVFIGNPMPYNTPDGDRYNAEDWKFPTDKEKLLLPITRCQRQSLVADNPSRQILKERQRRHTPKHLIPDYPMPYERLIDQKLDYYSDDEGDAVFPLGACCADFKCLNTAQVNDTRSLRIQFSLFGNLTTANLFSILNSGMACITLDFRVGDLGSEVQPLTIYFSTPHHWEKLFIEFMNAPFNVLHIQSVPGGGVFIQVKFAKCVDVYQPVPLLTFLHVLQQMCDSDLNTTGKRLVFRTNVKLGGQEAVTCGLYLNGTGYSIFKQEKEEH